MRITELFTAQSIALDEAQQDRSQIIDRLVELQATTATSETRKPTKRACMSARTRARPMLITASPSPMPSATA